MRTPHAEGEVCPRCFNIRFAETLHIISPGANKLYDDELRLL